MADEKKDHLKDLQWQGRAIAEKDHAHDLDREAAMHEFGNKLPRAEAEEKAYESYKKDQHARAAAHHLQGMKAAHASGNMEEARKHGILYDQHVKGLGHESSIGPVPSSISRYVSEDDKGPYKFKAHHGDRFVLDKSEDTMADLKKDTAYMGAAELEKDHSLRNVVLGHSTPKAAPAVSPGSSPQIVGSQSAFGAKDKPVLKDETRPEVVPQNSPEDKKFREDNKKATEAGKKGVPVNKDEPELGDAAEAAGERQCQVCDSSTRVAVGKIGSQHACSLCIKEHDKKTKKSEVDEELRTLYKAAKAILDGALKKGEGK
jgi:hypothetical protein